MRTNFKDEQWQDNEVLQRGLEIWIVLARGDDENQSLNLGCRARCQLKRECTLPKCWTEWLNETTLGRSKILPTPLFLGSKKWALSSWVNGRGSPACGEFSMSRLRFASKKRRWMRMGQSLHSGKGKICYLRAHEDQMKVNTLIRAFVVMFSFS